MGGDDGLPADDGGQGDPVTVAQGDPVTATVGGALQPRVHHAARLEDAVHEVVERWLRRRGWHVTVTGYTGYGAPGWVRVMGRVLLSRLDPRQLRRAEKVRGWRSFMTLPVQNARVVIEAAGHRHEVRADRGGFVDCVVEGEFTPGWTTVSLYAGAPDTVDGAAVVGAEGDGAAGRSGLTGPVEAPVRILDPAAQVGILSDIDDTVMVTALPRPLLAAWNTFVLDEHARMAVPGMNVLFERLATAYPGGPVFYLSTGAWNVAPALTRFLARHLYPAGPLLLTDWGPTADRWFRSGREHKRATLRRLVSEFPDVRWLLIGDDGQHDEEIYAEFAQTHPDNVAAVAIRRLSPTQSVLAGSPLIHAVEGRAPGPPGVTWLSAPDGAGLWRLMREAELV